MNLEFGYLATLTRDYFLPEGKTRRPPAGLNWPHFIKLCAEQKVAGTLLGQIQKDGLGNETIQDLIDTQRHISETTIFRLLFLEQFLPELENAGCRPIVLKGGVLASSYYNRPEDRYLADLDILVEPDQLDLACSVLKDMGLKLAHTSADPGYYQDHHFHWIMDNESGFTVEVHWALTRPQSIYSFDLAGLRARSVVLPLNRTMMRCPAPVDLLLHVAHQCSTGDFGEMRRIIDAALIFAKVEDSDALVRQALVQNQGIALWMLLTQVARYSTIPVPRDILDRLAPGRNTQKIMSDQTERLLRESGKLHYRGKIHHLLHWLCAPTPAFRCRELWRFLYPGEEHWLELGYPPENFPSLWIKTRTRLARFRIALYLCGIAVISLFSKAKFSSSHSPEDP